MEIPAFGVRQTLAEAYGGILGIDEIKKGGGKTPHPHRDYTKLVYSTEVHYDQRDTLPPLF